jgi:hypothetical protein
MKKITHQLWSIALFAGLLLSSCQKEKLNPVITDEPVNFTTQETAIHQNLLRTQIVFAALNISSGSFKNGMPDDILSCAEVSTDSASMPRVTVINFGLSGCLGADGVTRKGKVLISYDGDYHDAGTEIITTFSEYSEDENQVSGTETMRNTGRSGNDKITYSISQTFDYVLVNGGTESDVLTGNCEWLAGDLTQTTDDDQYTYAITLNQTLQNGDSQTWTCVPGSLPIIDWGCRYRFVQGKISCHRPASYDSDWDFGNGTCDNAAMVTENGSTNPVVLK